MSIGKHQNIIGPLVQELREGKGLSREAFAEELRAIGWDIPEGQIEKIEAREVMVKDFETLYLLRALEISQDEFWRRLAASGTDGQEPCNEKFANISPPLIARQPRPNQTFDLCS